jgi:predicted metal-binding membrane protein
LTDRSSEASGDLRALREPLVAVMGLLVAAAWLALMLWATSPYGRYLDHGNWSDIGLAAALCRALPAGQVLLPGLIYAGGWLLMTTAMMLPTTLPLLRRFERLTSGRPDRHRLVFLLIVGYLLVWGSFGIAAHLLDTMLNLIVRQSDWLVANGWMLGAVVLVAAGAFQFSRLKYRCLDQCRSPVGFIARHWRGRWPNWDALRLGVDHGAFCVGCCWAIMLLMFVVGTGNVGWMLALGAIMAVEKNLPWGRRLSRPLGAVLVTCGVLVVAANTG